MANNNRMSGVLAPVVTPFKRDLSPDAARLARHCQWLVQQDCGLALFGTNSEANSLSLSERMQLLDAVAGAGIDPARMMPGTGVCAIPETVELTRHALSHGVGGILMLPPFYFKGVSDEGLFRAYAEVIERVGDDRLRIYLYHFPKMSGVPLGVDLVRRLLEAFPGIVVGMKDSSGELANLERMLTAFPGFAMFAGTETLLLANMRFGGAGCISATANINPAAIVRLFDNWETSDADAQQEALDRVRLFVQGYPLVAALKATLAHYADDPDWNRLRPPLTELDDAAAAELLAGLAERDFEMPGLTD